MQIRQLTLKELYPAYDLVRELYPEFSYAMFEDRIYEMRHMEYKMFGILEGEALVCYGGVAVHTTLALGRHLVVSEFVTALSKRQQGYGEMMLSFLEDYGRMCACEQILVSSSVELHTSLFQRLGFMPRGFNYLKEI